MSCGKNMNIYQKIMKTKKTLYNYCFQLFSLFFPRRQLNQ